MFLIARATLLAMPAVVLLAAASPFEPAAAAGNGSEIVPTPENRLRAPTSRRDDGMECRTDSNCASRKCRTFPDGNSYCLAENRNCVVPGANGANYGTAYKVGTQCYQCVQQLGWQPCKPASDANAAAQQQGQGKRLGQNLGRAQGGTGLGQTSR